MINRLKIKNFKSHKNSEFKFSNLTVLCGANGVGKSSLIQVLLLLRESYFGNSNFDYLDLKSNSVTIGSAEDALYQFSENNIIAFEVCTDFRNYVFSFETSDSDLVKTLISKSRDADHEFDKRELIKESIFNKNFQFISAARMGPQKYYPKDDVVIDVYNQISVIEGRAEHFIHFLNKKKDKEVLSGLINEGVQFTDLYNQTTAWEREISEGVNITLQDIGSLGYELKYRFNTNLDVGKTNEFKSSNVGFGLTYVMPVIVAILSAERDGLLLIENPEAHLHPNGIARLAELICLAAQSGIQIIIETHSDHVINGILVQCKRFEETCKGISRENVSIYHFQRSEDDHSTFAIDIPIEEGGLIRYAPTGFFDQFTIDRKFLMGI